VAFESAASNLVPGGAAGHRNIFIRDRATGTTELVSVAAGGTGADGNSFNPAISPDGRYVAFDSEATNLVASDTNGFPDVFVRDRLTGTTERVSVASGGAQGNSSSGRPAISADGRYVAFESAASNLVAGGTFGNFDIFVRDRLTGTTERVSVTSGGVPANLGTNFHAASSDDRRYVAYPASATHVAGGDSNGADDI